MFSDVNIQPFPRIGKYFIKKLLTMPISITHGLFYVRFRTNSILRIYSNMLTVKTYLGQSKIDGIGTFAGEFITKGTVLWKLQKDFDMIFSNVEFSNLPEIAKLHVKHFGYYDELHGGHVLCSDNGKFFNHSETPNTDDVGELTIANQDIEIGTEIVSNYYTFDYKAKDKPIAN